jgi:putative salt-induced outer membrane protein YdiY
MPPRPGSKSRLNCSGAAHRRGLHVYFRLLAALLLTAGVEAGSGLGLGLGQEFHFILRNGDRLTGTVVAEDAVNVIITNSLLGRVLIPAAQLQRREPAPPSVATVPAPQPVKLTNAPPALTPEQKKRLDGLLQVFMAGQISGAEFQRRRESILAPRPPGPKHWSGEILAGIDVGYGAKSRQNFSGRVKINYTEKRLRNAFDYLFTYGHTEGELSANRMDSTDKLDYDLNQRHYLYALVGAGYDQIRKIDYYAQAGPGVGEHLIKRTNFVLNTEVGMNYQLQNFEGGQDSYLFYYRLAQDSKWTISSKFSFDQKVEYTPQWNELNQFKARAEANLRYWLLDNLSLNFTVIDLYDTRVARGISKNDLQIRSSIGVKF